MGKFTLNDTIKLLKVTFNNYYRFQYEVGVQKLLDALVGFLMLSRDFISNKNQRLLLQRYLYKRSPSYLANDVYKLSPLKKKIINEANSNL